MTVTHPAGRFVRATARRRPTQVDAAAQLGAIDDTPRARAAFAAWHLQDPKAASAVVSAAIARAVAAEVALPSAARATPAAAATRSQTPAAASFPTVDPPAADYPTGWAPAPSHRPAGITTGPDRGPVTCAQLPADVRDTVQRLARDEAAEHRAMWAAQDLYRATAATTSVPSNPGA